jgi:Domain of unknown function (DUF4382)
MPNIAPTAVLRPCSRTPNLIRLPALALLACAVLAGCKSETNVSATGNAPAQFTHVFLTINQIWFNTGSGATFTSSGWNKFVLTTPTTIDLATLNNGTLSEFASSLKLSSGTYGQVMLILADSTDTLTSSASSAGAATNDEVDYLDASGVAHTVPLAILNAAQGIGISTSLTVAAPSTSLGGDSTGTSTTTSSTVISSEPTSSSTFSAPVVATTSAIIDFDATRDLVPISLSGQPAFALNPHPQAYNAGSSGTIAGAVALTNVSTLTTADLPDVQVAAEALSADGTRHIIVKTTIVGSDGSFTLYPLSTVSTAPTTYDLVIHGPSIETVIIKSVPVTNAAPGAAAAVLGTLTLTPATPYLVNVNPSSPASPSSSSVGFYQTLPLSSEVPYLVEQYALDPTSGVFAAAEELSGGAMQYGSYVSGGTIALTSVNASQGAGTYAIGAINPAYGTSTLGTTVTAPASTTITQLFTMTAPPAPSGATANSIQGTVSLQGSTFNNAELFLTYNGTLVAAAPLSVSQGNLNLSGIAPGGSSSASYAPGVYYAEIWAWNSSNPTGTLTRMPYANTIDMSAGNATGVTLTLP